MLKIFIINAHWYNRGDEAALRAMIDELLIVYPDAQITVSLLAGGEYFPYKGNTKLLEGGLPSGEKAKWTDYILRFISKGNIGIKKGSRVFLDVMKESDLVIHAPGGPSIGDIYINSEKEYLARLMMANRLKKPYVFYAPSMGPFYKKKNNYLRKRILENAKFIAVREPQSAKYLKEYSINKKIHITRDSAFQNPIDCEKYHKLYLNDRDLQNFINRYRKVIGITITDLQWNPKYMGDEKLAATILDSFKQFIDYLNDKKFGVLFIPQLFAVQNDYTYMESFSKSNCYVLPVREEYDCYFQQYIISQIYLVVGMRYHSNIFAAKMKTPFVSISYEQKMSGFMLSAGLNNYCIPVEKLSYAELKNYFETACNQYDDYKKYLELKSCEWMKEAHETTDLVIKTIEELQQK